MSKSKRTDEHASGILIVDKPALWTSHDVVARVRRVFRTKRVGHTGTLDPFATGVLVLLIGHATRLAQFLAHDEKEYEAVIRFGYKTTTGDLTGERVGEDEVFNHEDLTIERIESAMRRMTGVQEQTPPMYSAKKIDGVKLYELARKGIEVERKAVEIMVRGFELMDLESINHRDTEEEEETQRFIKLNDDGTCDVRVRAVCSAGTYIRVLAEDLGARLGAGAHLVELRRTRAGDFDLSRAVTLDELQSLIAADNANEVSLELQRKLLPLASALPQMPTVHLTNDQLARVRHGAAVEVEELFDKQDATNVCLLDERAELIAVGVYDAARKAIQPRVLLVTQETVK